MGLFNKESAEIAFLRSSYQDFDKFKQYLSHKSKKSSEKGRKYINSLKKECYFCSSTENLRFLHKNPLTKTHDVERMIKNSQKSIDKEVEKCWCVCKTCKYRLSNRLMTPLPEFLT